MKIAIIIAVSDYTNASDLPACVNDAEVIKTIIEEAGTFDEILMASSDTQGRSVKTKLANLIRVQKNNDIEEVFFYYTGHGGVFNDDFHFLLSDFDENKRSQTSISNKDLDDMLRSLSPKLVVKVVDACHAGVSYVKSSTSLEKSLAASKQRLLDCYFMFSSKENQSSYQDEDLSDFTREFGNAILEHQTDSIRYKEIAEHLSDAFSGETQTPRFLFQTDFTEVFCHIDSSLRTKLKGLVKPSSHSASSTDASPADIKAKIEAVIQPASLLEAVMIDSDKYTTKEEASAQIEELKSTLEAHKINHQLEELYDLAIELKSDHLGCGVPSTDTIARWLDKETHDLFVDVVFTSESYEVEEEVPSEFSGPLHLLPRGFRTPQTRTVTKKRLVPYDFNSTCKMPFSFYKAKYRAKFENLPSWNTFLFIFLSKKDVRFFQCITEMHESEWNSFQYKNRVRWTTSSSTLKPEGSVSKKGCQLQKEFETQILNSLNQTFNMDDDNDSSDIQSNS